MEPTIVFAGVDKRDLPMLQTCKADAIMVSFYKLKGDKKMQAIMREGLPWPVRTYLDSGVFTFLRRAGVGGTEKAKKEAATWDEFRAFSIEYINYLKANPTVWDYVIELDVEELFGIDVADRYREGLRSIVGDRLMPVWHTIRGDEGWTKMVNEYKYVAISGWQLKTGYFHNTGRVRAMMREAHAAGCKVHLLGQSTMEHFEQYEVDTVDSSSWTAGPRWGEFKVNRGKVTLPKGARCETLTCRHSSDEHPEVEGQVARACRKCACPAFMRVAKRRAVTHSHLAQLQEMLSEWNISLDQARNDTAIAREVGVRLLMRRQEEVRKNASRRIEATV